MFCSSLVEDSKRPSFGSSEGDKVTVYLFLYRGDFGDYFFGAVEGGGDAAERGEDTAEVVVEEGIGVRFCDGEGIGEFCNCGEVGGVFHEFETAEVTESGKVSIRYVCRNPIISQELLIS